MIDKLPMTEDQLRREVVRVIATDFSWPEATGELSALPEVIRAFDALRDHYQARPTFEGDEAEVRKRLAARSTVRDEFGIAHPLVNPDGPKALALLDAKDAEIARLNASDVRMSNTADQFLRERDEALARAERAERALADRDAAIEPFKTFASFAVDADGWKSRIGHERICDWFGPSDFKPFLPAPEPVSDPLVEEAREIWNCAVEAVPANIQAHSCPAAIEVIRTALAARGEKAVLEGERK